MWPTVSLHWDCSSFPFLIELLKLDPISPAAVEVQAQSRLLSMKKIRELFLQQLRQGADARSLALALAFGVAIGHFPVFGATTSLCLIAGWIWKLNHALLQAVNYLLAPLQILTIPLWLWIGETLFGVAHISINPVVLIDQFRQAPGLFFHEFGWAMVHAICGWSAVVPIISVAVYWLMLPVFRRVQKQLLSP